MQRTFRAIRVSIALLAAAIVIAGCGRREQKEFFDAPQMTSTAPKPANAPPLPESAIHVKWGSATAPATIARGTSAAVMVTLTNAGDQTWPDPATGDPEKRAGAYAVRVGHSWKPASEPDAVAPKAQMRTDLPAPLKAGESVTLAVNVVAPATPGDYILEFDLVQELLFWFSGRGADTLKVPVKVL